MTPTGPKSRRLLPLPPATFHILLALVDEDRTATPSSRTSRRAPDGELRLSAGTLYRSDRSACSSRGSSPKSTQAARARLDDERRRYYRITPFGTAVARAEWRGSPSSCDWRGREASRRRPT